MQMDYSGLETQHRLHDNVFGNPTVAMVGWGGLTAGGWGMKYMGNRISGRLDGAFDDAYRRALIAGDKVPHPRAGSGLSRAEMLSVHKGPEWTRADRRVRAIERVRRGQKARGAAITSAGSGLTRWGRAIGWLGMAQIGYEIVGGMASIAKGYTPANEVQQYDQDTYFDTRAAHTQRQRALQVIHNSRLSLRPVLGNESNYLHY